jgi:hypothetical protein
MGHLKHETIRQRGASGSKEYVIPFEQLPPFQPEMKVSRQRVSPEAQQKLFNGPLHRFSQ